MTDPIEFFCAGVPKPGGSKKGFLVNGRVNIVEDCARNKDWRASVALAGQEAMAGRPPLDVPLSVAWLFTLPRPKGHYGGGKNAGKLKPSAPYYHSSKPDTTKLVRAAEDALTNVCWRDDALIVHQSAAKVYGSKPGVMVVIAPAAIGGAP